MRIDIGIYVSSIVLGNIKEVLGSSLPRISVSLEEKQIDISSIMI